MSNLVSVIIPAKDAALYIAQCLESAVKQEFQNTEIIVVDDKSSDSTGEIVKEFIEAYPSRIRLIFGPGKGPGAARNAGVRASKGDFIAFLDADDVWLPRKLALQVPYLVNSPDVGVVYSDRLWIDSEGNLTNSGYDQKDFPSGDIFPQLIEANLIGTPSVLIRRSCLAEAGLFSETDQFKNCEDYHLWLRLASKFTFIGINEKLWFYRRHDGNATNYLYGRYLGMKGCLRYIDHSDYWLKHDKNKYQYIIDSRKYNIFKGFGMGFIYNGEYRYARDAFREILKLPKTPKMDYLFYLSLFIPLPLINVARMFRSRAKKVLSN